MSKSGRLAQHKFRLGKDRNEAQRRDRKLRQLWEGIEALSSDQPPRWDAFTLDAARQIAKGNDRVAVSRNGQEAEEYAAYVHRLQIDFPMLSLYASDEAAYLTGAQVLRIRTELVQDSYADKTVASGTVVNPSVAASTSSPKRGPRLHAAFRSYIEWIREEYRQESEGDLSAYGRTKIRQVETMIDRHKNVPLASIDQEAVEAMVRYWRLRPAKKGTNRPIARKTAQNLIGEVKRFFRWLQRSKAYAWQEPIDFGCIKATVGRDVAQQQRKLAQVDTFSLDELTRLNHHASPLERVFLLLGLNCGFGAAEIGSLLVSELFFRQAHDPHHQEMLHYRTTDDDSFIKRVRRKSGVYGEHLLFAPTVQALEWALRRRAESEHSDRDGHVLLTKSGAPYDQPTQGGNRNQLIPNRFADLRRRVAKEGEPVANLSFGKLRKTAGDLVRRFSDGEIAGVFLCHGSPVVTDNLADVYTNRPFGKVFRAIREVEAYLAPVFAAADTANSQS
ncbi:MAG: hypothetical protein KDA42_07495 [Planctomycetales bacterium]|nr:hypothetical protein [Planctomycetales bacterium]